MALPESWHEPIQSQLGAWTREASQDGQAARQAVEAELADLDARVERLTDAYLAGELTRDAGTLYRRVPARRVVPRKENRLHAKADCKAKLTNLSVTGNSWLEPAKHFIEACAGAASVARSGNLTEIAGFLKTAGSNLTLKASRAHAD